MLSLSRAQKPFGLGVQCFLFIFPFCFVFAGADIVQWLMKNLSIEDPGKVTIAGDKQTLNLYCVCVVRQ